MLQAFYNKESGELTLTDIFEEGGAVIKMDRTGKVKLYEIPQYGGDERFVGEYTNVVEAIEISNKWT